MAKLTQCKWQQISFHAPSNVENHFKYELPVSPRMPTIFIHFGPVSPLTSWPVDDPGLEEIGRRESRWEKGVQRGRKSQSEKRKRDEEQTARCEARERKRKGRILVGRREMKRGLLWFRRWPVVTSSRLGSTARFEQERDRVIGSERERIIGQGTGSILLASCGGCYTSETLHLASSEGTVWACSLSAIRPCTFDSQYSS